MIPMSSNFIQVLACSFQYAFWIMTSVSPFTPAGPSDPAPDSSFEETSDVICWSRPLQPVGQDPPPTETNKASAGCVVGGAASKELQVTLCYFIGHLWLTSMKLQSFLCFSHSTFWFNEASGSWCWLWWLLCLFRCAFLGFHLHQWLAELLPLLWTSWFSSGLCRSWNFGSLLWLRLREGSHTAYIRKWHPTSGS